MIDKRLTLDTNILIYSVDKDAAEKHSVAMNIVDEAIELDCVLTIQVLSEFYSAATRKKYLRHEEAVDLIKIWSTLFPIVDGGTTVLMRALRAVEEHQISFWDAMIWGAAKEARCTLILSEDFQDGRNLEGVLFRNPFKNGFNNINEIFDTHDRLINS